MERRRVDQDLIARFRAYQAEYPCWGLLHIVLDDGNIEDSSVQFCLDYGTREGDVEGVELATILLGLSKTQRNKIASLA